MTIGFDAGYGAQPFRALCEEYPDETAYPRSDFRIEWGPIFHRGRLDGSARVLVIGQDPAQHETIARRILVGEAGHRIQGFLAKLGIERSYVMVNTFLYSVYGKGGAQHVHDAAIESYRNRWFDVILETSSIDAVVALGTLADKAWTAYRATATGSAYGGRYAHITHPTQPESASGGDAAMRTTAIRHMLEHWNTALRTLHPLPYPDAPHSIVPYGKAFAAGDKLPIPAIDLPAGLPPWMATNDGWAQRGGKKKRAAVTVTVPANELT